MSTFVTFLSIVISFWHASGWKRKIPRKILDPASSANHRTGSNTVQSTMYKVQRDTREGKKYKGKSTKKNE